MIAAFLPLETERLRLRCYRLSDQEDAREISQNPDVRRWIPGGCLSEDAYRDFLNASCLSTAVDFLVERSEDGTVIGEATIAPGPELGSYDIGWLLLPPYQGQGYATEMGQALVTLGFERLQARELRALCHPDNLPSRRVMARLGFEDSGGLEGDATASFAQCVYLLRADPSASNAAADCPPPV